MSLRERRLKIVGVVPPRETVWLASEDFDECFAHLGTIRVSAETGAALGFPENGEVISLPVAVDQPGRAPVPIGELVVIRAEDCFFGMLCRGPAEGELPPQGLFVASAFRVRFENPSADPVSVRATIDATVTEPIRTKSDARPARSHTPPRGRARVG